MSKFRGIPGLIERRPNRHVHPRDLPEQFSPALFRECVNQDIRKGIGHFLASPG